MLAFQFFSLPAAGLFFLVLFNQLVGAYKQIAGFSNISFLCHLGGAAVGLVGSFITPHYREDDEI